MTTDDELARWDALETAERVRAGEVSAREVLEAAIERAEAARPLGALVTAAFDRARRALPTRRGPLAGVPTFIKDLAQLEGVRTAWGSAATGAYVSRASDPFVRRFEATGVSTLGKSATPELGMTATTEPVGQPPCRNPWDPSRSAGGSSGGAAALVAAGVVPLAHASDGGGSIRIPASCCGLVGLKVSRGRMDMEGSPLLPVNVAVHGCVSRTVRDTIAFWEALEARRRGIAAIGHVAAAPSASLRVGVFVESPTGTPVHDDHRSAALAAARLCERLGHRVEEIGCPFDATVNDDFLLLWGMVAWMQTSSGKVLIHRRFDASKLEPWTRGMARYFTSQPWTVVKAIGRLRGFTRRYAELMRRFDVLVSPTLASPPPELGHLATDAPFATAFERLRAYAPFTPLVNVAGAPAISLPLGTSAGGLPAGVQLAAAYGEERTLLALARSIEEAAPWPRLAPAERWVDQRATGGPPSVSRSARTR